jgi:hypothetical protein
MAMKRLLMLASINALNLRPQHLHEHDSASSHEDSMWTSGVNNWNSVLDMAIDADQTVWDFTDSDDNDNDDEYTGNVFDIGDIPTAQGKKRRKKKKKKTKKQRNKEARKQETNKEGKKETSRAPHQQRFQLLLKCPIQRSERLNWR